MSVVISRMDTIEERTVKWLWPGRIPLGKVTMLAGDPGVGKSFLTNWLAARVSKAEEFPDGTQSLRAPGDVLLLSAEDDAHDTIKPRLRHHGADMSRVHIIEGIRESVHNPHREGDASLEKSRERIVGVDFDRHLHHVEAALRSVERPRLIIIDPISAYLGQTDGNSNGAVRGLMRGLTELAHKYGPAILCVTHLNKGSTNGTSRTMYRAMGSLAFLAAARLAYFVTIHPDDDTLRAIAPIKSNLDTKRTTMTYSIGSEGITWVSVDDAATLRDLENPTQEEDPSARSEGEEFLRAMLKDGPRPASELIAEAASSGIKDSTLRRAKKRLNLLTTKDGMTGGWTWALPTHATPHATPDATSSKEAP